MIGDWFPGMARYYFDLYDDDGVVAVDEEGMDLPSLAAAQAEAAQALADMVWDAAQEIPQGIAQGSSSLLMAVEVRDDKGPVLQVKYSFEIGRLS